MLKLLPHRKKSRYNISFKFAVIMQYDRHKGLNFIMYHKKVNIQKKNFNRGMGSSEKCCYVTG